MAVDEDDGKDVKFSFEFVVSRCETEERRHALREQDAVAKSEAAALLALKKKPVGNCVHCGKHDDSNRCFLKYPHLAPPGHPYRRRHQALLGREVKNSEQVDDDADFICLFGNPLENNDSSRDRCLNISNIEKSLPKFSRDWVLDSGSTAHLTYNRSVFSSYREISPKILDLGADSTALIVGHGDVTLQISVNGKLRKCRIKNVRHVPSLRYNLISIPTMALLGHRTSFDIDGAIITQKRDGKLLATGSLLPTRLYTLDLYASQPTSNIALVTTLRLWHERLAHVDSAGIKSMADHGVVEGIKYASSKIPECTGCILGKGHRTPIPKKSLTQTSKVLELVHSDVLGPIEVKSVGGSRYVITFIDDYSNWTAEYTMRKKSESLDRFKQYKTYAECHTNQVLQKLHVHESMEKNDDSVATDIKLKILRSDNGGEYLSNEFKQFLSDHGIKHELTVSYTPQQNGVAERMNRTLLNLVRSLLYHKNIEKRFWAEAMATAVYVRNRVTSRALPANTTPHHIWHGTTPNLSHLRVFGSQCWYVVPKQKVKKLDPRAREAIMMGYSTQSKGYKFWDIESKKFVVSRDVKFIEENDAERIEG